VLGRDLLREERGREDGLDGLSDGKKPDFRLAGEGDGGI